MAIFASAVAIALLRREDDSSEAFRKDATPAQQLSDLIRHAADALDWLLLICGSDNRHVPSAEQQAEIRQLIQELIAWRDVMQLMGSAKEVEE